MRKATAQPLTKPLFHITCGDLGTTAREVETELEGNIALATRWTYANKKKEKYFAFRYQFSGVQDSS